MLCHAGGDVNAADAMVCSINPRRKCLLLYDVVSGC